MSYPLYNHLQRLQNLICITANHIYYIATLIELFDNELNVEAIIEAASHCQRSRRHNEVAQTATTIRQHPHHSTM